MIRRAPKPARHTCIREKDLAVTITVGRDGRVYFEELTAELIGVAAALRPEDADLKRREAAARKARG